PVRSEGYHTGSGAVPAFFAGLLPEGARLAAVVAAVKTSMSDELSLLLAVADDAIGDVSVVPAGSPTPPVRHADPVDPATTSFAELFAASVDPTTAELDRALPGIQDKLSSATISFPLAAADGPSILKLSPPSYPLLVENEAFCLGLAADVGLRTPPYQVIRDADGTTALLVSRFDRVADGDGWRRVAQEDACQFLDRWPADKYRISVNEIAERLVDLASSPPSAVLDLVLQVAFSWVVGNGDLHSKNFSLQWHPDAGLVAASPIYDVVTTLPYPLDLNMALRVDGRDANIQGRFLVEFAGRFDAPAALVCRRLGELADRLDTRLDGAGEIGFDTQTSERLVAEMRRRLEVLRRFER
ncbi:HipA domain-containing protein, partial [bacterium]|nr:HipA domain-containing protein [bacterium]